MKSFCNEGFSVWMLFKCLNWDASQRIIFILQTHSVKACVRYLLTNFYFLPNDGPSKTMKDVFYFIKKIPFVLEKFKFLYFHLPLFFFLSDIALDWSKINLKVYNVINCLNKNLITHFVCYFEKEKRLNFVHW